MWGLYSKINYLLFLLHSCCASQIQNCVCQLFPTLLSGEILYAPNEESGRGIYLKKLPSRALATLQTPNAKLSQQISRFSLQRGTRKCNWANTIIVCSSKSSYSTNTLAKLSSHLHWFDWAFSLFLTETTRRGNPGLKEALRFRDLATQSSRIVLQHWASEYQPVWLQKGGH